MRNAVFAKKVHSPCIFRYCRKVGDEGTQNRTAAVLGGRRCQVLAGRFAVTTPAAENSGGTVQTVISSPTLRHYPRFSSFQLIVQPSFARRTCPRIKPLMTRPPWFGCAAVEPPYTAAAATSHTMASSMPAKSTAKALTACNLRRGRDVRGTTTPSSPPPTECICGR